MASTKQLVQLRRDFENERHQWNAAFKAMAQQINALEAKNELLEQKVAAIEKAGNLPPVKKVEPPTKSSLKIPRRPAMMVNAGVGKDPD